MAQSYLTLPCATPTQEEQPVARTLRMSQPQSTLFPASSNRQLSLPIPLAPILYAGRILLLIQEDGRREAPHVGLQVFP